MQGLYVDFKKFITISVFKLKDSEKVFRLFVHEE